MGLWSGNSYAAESPSLYTLNPALSQLNLVTIKKQYVLEVAEIENLSGVITADGKVAIIAPINGINTGIPIRNTRLNDLFFESIKFPNIKIAADLKDYKSNESQSIERRSIGFDIELYGKTKHINTEVFISTSNNQLLVSSIAPIIISSDDFDIPVINLINLAKAVGGIPISNTVPVSFNIVFDITYPNP